MPAYVKRVPFRFVNVRPRKLKPRWHDFYCAGCGVGMREFSDPRYSFYLCPPCADRRVWSKLHPRPSAPQVVSAVDWWALWAMEYESKRAAGVIDASGKEIEHG